MAFKFSYSVKFVCGTQIQAQTTPNACFPVRPGTYATEINIYNYHLEQPAQIEKLYIPFVLNGEVIGREPRVVGVRQKETITLKPQTGTMDDCCRIDELLKLPPGAGLTIGYLQILSPVELSVTAVYTANDPRSNSLSIDVNQVQAQPLP